MNKADFEEAFEALTGNPPFPWQWNLYQKFLEEDFPSSCNLPTGLGKTSVIHIWLLALAHAPNKVPRRLIYVVNRRTVVDQSTNEAIKLRNQLLGEFGPSSPIVYRLRTALANLASDPTSGPLAISTLRGQLADNREWCSDPARPAVIAGTVDMIGSRLLFSGYGCGFKSRPLHAGFLGHDALLVHDEAHLEPAFQELIEAIQSEQNRQGFPDMKSRRIRVMALTATTRQLNKPPTPPSISLTVDPLTATTRQQLNNPFGLTEDDHGNEVVKQRIHAKKGIKFHPVKNEKGVTAENIGGLAAAYKDSQLAILVFVRTIDDVNVVQKKIAATKAEFELLTGTIRGKERDELISKPVFRRFRPGEQDGAATGTAYLICTSAGEVGIDISADHLVCDLTPFDSMAQRFGRVNRRGGEGKKARIDVVHEMNPDPKKKDDLFEKARWQTLNLLRDKLPPCAWDPERKEASPASLENMMANLSEEQRFAAFTPQPQILPATDILFDSWALTTIRGKLPGRPMVEPYLHGISIWEPPETQVAWREEVGVITGNLLEQYKPEDLLEDYPLKPHELLRDKSNRVFDWLKKLKAAGMTSVWVVSNDNSVEVTTLEDLIEAGKEELNNQTLLLPPAAGGLENGMLTSNSPTANDVADDWHDEMNERRRIRLWDGDARLGATRKIMRLIRRIDFDSPEDDEGAEVPSWHWFTRPNSADDDGSKTAKAPITWQHHTCDVEKGARRLADLLLKDQPPLHEALVLAAKFHDLGKMRVLWQKSIGNPNPTDWYAKSGKDPKTGRVWKPLGFTDYRHEFGSLVDVLDEKQKYHEEFRNLSDEKKDLILHLIAVHHGYGRPHFPADRAYDPVANEIAAAQIAAEIPLRFARLQRKYGRWGLAYLESLLRAADYFASANPSKTEDEQ